MVANKKPGFTRAKKKVDLSKAESFISGAEKPPHIETEIQIPETKKQKVEETVKIKIPTPIQETKTANKDISEPWDNANERIIKGVNLRLTEPQWMKLRYITDNTPFSIQKFIMSILEPAIEKKLNELKN